MWLLKLDASGTIQWEKTYGGNVSNSANSIRQIHDGGYIVAGTTISFGGNANFWELKLDGTGDIGAGCTLIATSHGTVANTGAQAVDSSGTQNTTNALVVINQYSAPGNQRHALDPVFLSVNNHCQLFADKCF